uniref:Golgi apparatus membrane protein TVP23 homolog n=1 Tax=Timspurckia oligopyrenoides TaxID=708627 RepID=A0A7S1EU47_9RHOD|mmetsp:Transcript_8976/g.16171  ORF Transcript_8976/g.16171 Transcript_8976/m.16171 type:complete len:218 (+) Transcript_8976:41-694(+)
MSSAKSSGAAGDSFYEDDGLPSERPPIPPGTDHIGANEGMVTAVFRASSHPTVAVFHVFFKICAITSYLLLGLFTHSFVFQFVITVTMLAFDFWTVKNVSGRLMVGLRWWSDVNEDGSTSWRFETLEDPASVSTADHRIFWWSMYVTPIVWVTLGVVSVLKFNLSWLIVVFIALVLTGANLWGYMQCDKEAQKRIQNAVGNTFLHAALNRFMPFSGN